MKEYESPPSEDDGKDAVNEPPAGYEVAGAASAELESYWPPESLPAAGQVKYAEIPRDENGNIIGTPWEEVLEKLDRTMSEYYGVDFHKITLMLRSGELSEDEITEELMLGPEFRYEPYPGFTPGTLPEDFAPDPDMLAALDNEE